MRTISLIITILSSIIIYACSGSDQENVNELLNTKIPSKLVPLEYISFIENPIYGLNQTVNKGDYSFQLQYKPLDYIIAKSENKAKLEKSFVEEERKSLGDLQYYTFKIKANNGEADILKDGVRDEQEFGGRIAYFSFQMQSDLFVVEKSDTLPCLLFHMERTYGVAPYCTFVLGFEDKKQKNNQLDRKFLYNDRVFNQGIIDFTIKGSDIDRLPKLIIE